MLPEVFVAVPSEADVGKAITPATVTIKLAEDGKNYPAWKTLVPVLIQAYPMAWEYTSGKTAVPTTPDAAYKKADLFAKTVILNSLPTSLITELFYDKADATSSTLMWEAIKTKFSNKAALNQEQIITKFVTFKFDSNKNVSQNIKSFIRLKNLASELENKLSEDIMVVTLLNALPSSWESMRLGWSTLDKSKKTITNLISLIETEALRRGELETEVNNTAAFLSRVNIRRRSKPPFRKSNFRNFRKPFGPQCNKQAWSKRTFQSSSSSSVTCYKCGKIGHMANRCKRKTKKTAKPQQPADTANIDALNIQIGNVSSNHTFLIDSGASHHVVNDLKWFTTYEQFTSIRNVRMGSSHSLSAYGEGLVILAVGENDQLVNVELHNVMYVPKMRHNLISVSSLTDDGYTVAANKHAMTLCKNNISVTASRIDKLFALRVSDVVSIKAVEFNESLCPEPRKTSLRLAHQTLGHIGIDKVKQLLTRYKINYEDDFTECESCVQGKMHRASYNLKPSESKIRHIGVIHTDLCSPSEVSLGRSKHFMILTDCYSKFRKVYFLKTKDEASDCL